MRLPLVTLVLVVTLVAPASAAVRLHRVGDFDTPVHVTGAPGDHERLYVVEQEGRIQVLRGGSKTLFVDLSGTVISYGEQGLLSLAFAPDYQRSRLLYVYFTNKAGNNEIDELRSSSGDTADASYRRRVLEIEHPVSTGHNAGQLQFGRDRYLYIATGDGYTLPGPQNAAQNLDSRLGKILRIDPRGGPPYGVPRDNPYVGRDGDDLVWAYGLRNPFRFSFDRATGDLTIGDVGEETTEEIDFVPVGAGAGRGMNFGWAMCEGSFVWPTTSVRCHLGTLPVIDRFHSDGWCAIIGGYVVRDPSLRSLRGRYVYGDLCNSALRSARLATPRAVDDRPLGVEVHGLTSLGEDAAGCLYATSLLGSVYRLVETSTQVPCPSDRRPPRLLVRVPRRQDLRRQGGVIAYARCDERCRVAISAELNAAGRSYALRRALKTAAAGRRVTLRARLTRRPRRALARALRAGRPMVVTVGLRARDRAGNRSSLVRRTVRVKRR
jgi:hypothetical protein